MSCIPKKTIDLVSEAYVCGMYLSEGDTDRSRLATTGQVCSCLQKPSLLHPNPYGFDQLMEDTFLGFD